MCGHNYICWHCGNDNHRVFMLVCTPCVSLVSPLQRAQARCLAVVDSLTGAARWMMMSWGGMSTETCSGNQTLWTQSFYASGFISDSFKTPSLLSANLHLLCVQLQEEDTGCRGHPEGEKDLLWLFWEVSPHLSYCLFMTIKLRICICW